MRIRGKGIFLVMPILELRQLSVNFGGVDALFQVSMDVEEGEIHGLIGPNGAGKSTLFNAITGIVRPSEGEVLFQGESITGYKPFQIAKIGISRTFQNLGLFVDMTALDNLIVGGLCRKDTRFWGSLFCLRKTVTEDKAITKKAENILEDLGLIDLRNQIIRGLPYGKRKAVELARALATDPKVLLLDEPGAGMNMEETENIMRILHGIKKRGYSICLVEHDMHMVMQLSDRISVLDFGVKIADGKPGEISKNEKVIDAYLGK